MAHAAADVSPIRRQYLELKRKYADCILFFRLGDFYETFDADAELVARELDVVLTSRPVAKDVRVPMAGVPHHAAESYIARLIERGYRVAIAEQIGNEAINGLVPREVRRVITPGTVLEEGMLDAARPNYLAAIVHPPREEGEYGFAYCDISTGEFWATQLGSRAALDRELARVQPREVVCAESVQPRPALPTADRPYALTPLADWRFELSQARQALLAHFNVASLHGFGLEDKPQAIRAAGAILAYLRDTQPAALAQLLTLRSYTLAQFVALDAATRRNLELVEPLRPAAQRGKPPTLLGVLDYTQTPMGARLLRTWITQPLCDRAAIEARLKRVDALFADALLRAHTREALQHMPDLERLAARVLSGLATPRELLNLKRAAAQWLRLAALVPTIDPALPTPDLQTVVMHIEAAVKDPPDGDGFIKPGYSAELDSVRAAAQDAKTWVANLERVERERTGIKSLKVGYNKVFGYYIEVTHANRDLVPADYIRKQTLANAERYITPQLKEYEALILNADERIAEIEQRLLTELVQGIAAHAQALYTAAQVIAQVDVAAALAEAAARHNYVRPRFNDEGRIVIREGRHPVIEHLLREVPYTPNDVVLDDEARILIITGPNMSGKSSYLRQTALIVLMAHIGSYVPAREADVCLVDAIFTRIGAQDELASGQSTFMVEMLETAHILNHCTPRSLVILDEIGRGTSTYDGLAIAWAVVEFLHNHPEHRAFTLFATHYHELIELERCLPHVRNYNVAVSEEGGTVVFLHKVVPGGADRSYGIHVAQLAGLPPAVIHRAQDVLAQLERGRSPSAPSPAPAVPPSATQLPLFASAPSPVVERLKRVDPNTLSPLEALTLLYELKRLAEQEGAA
ncbi:MAG: DNA mismatch repair protein MutS [Thermoflexales bacterium]|nr:DNA mismatch repair protein MutS [Thermoflexales bacterium]MCX7938863.1 DNA mismatch repair protein MutS [Thermoflexales bacterium]